MERLLAIVFRHVGKLLQFVAGPLQLGHCLPQLPLCLPIISK